MLRESVVEANQNIPVQSGTAYKIESNYAQGYRL